MVASTDKIPPKNTVTAPEFGGRSLLRSVVIYCPNAAGKSNLVAVVNFVVRFVRTSMERKLNTPIEVSPFLLVAEPNAAPSEFEITFIDEENGVISTDTLPLVNVGGACYIYK